MVIPTKLTGRSLLVGVALAATVFAIAGSAGARALAAPTISGFTPASGVVGTNVTITGTNFAGATGVAFGGVPASHFSISTSGTVIVATVPKIELPFGTPSAVTVTTPDGTATATAQFTVTAAAAHKNPGPNIHGLSPTSGKVGAKITIYGQHFDGALLVKFAGVKAHFRIPSTIRIVATVPKGARSGEVTVRTVSGLAKSPQPFKVTS